MNQPDPDKVRAYRTQLTRARAEIDTAIRYADRDPLGSLDHLAETANIIVTALHELRAAIVDPPHA